MCLREGGAVTFTFLNRCTGTVWPGILSNAGTARIEPTGFALPPGAARALPFPTGWSGRLWARTGCAQDAAGRFACATGDCGTGTLECAGRDGATPATLAEFTLDGTGGLDFYDVSLVDGYNLPVLVEPSSGERPGGASSAGSCASAGCAADLNAMCPAELRSGGGAACRSACDAFGRPEYCCSGMYANPGTCRPTSYSQVFKMACPRSYSYAFDDPTSTFTCAGGPDYTVTFCPGATPSQKSTTVPAATTTPTQTSPLPTTVPRTETPTTTVPGTDTPAMMPGMTFTDANQGSMPMPMGGEVGTGGGGGIQGQGVILGGASSDAWLANMATGDVTGAAAAPRAAASAARLVAAPLALLALHLLR